MFFAIQRTLFSFLFINIPLISFLLYVDELAEVNKEESFNKFELSIYLYFIFKKFNK